MSDGEWLQRVEGYVNGRATKSAIVERAAEAFAQQGFHGASVRGIARAAGIDHSTLLHHFGNKTMLLLAVLEWQDAQNLTASVPAEAPAEVTAEMLVDGFTATAERNRAVPGLVQLLSVMSAEAGAADHPARPHLQERHRIARDLIASMIRRQREAGAVGDDGLTPEQGAAVFLATWEGLQVYDALHPGELDIPALVARALREAFGLESA
ncbi:TetR/AcrR family transcriptional regulator [Microbacterium sp. 2FI]|uniref:TetR/AcrR family transcriptional regulator n=1 Tax=Microbacterium sp. 2FI TaxID=2502193 RepID=UPI0014851249|nr:TetR/AcrR family transcriptional regulator [Microbacterium sp. 2FI]